MKNQISHIAQGQTLDCYVPKANPLACFIGMAEQHLATLWYKPQYRIHTTEQGTFTADSTNQLKRMLNAIPREAVAKIRAYSETDALGSDNYIELFLAD